MAKGQKRSTREKKKPKKDKTKLAAPVSSFGSTLSKWQTEQNRTGKKGA